jgi:hypothetical protein
MFDPLFGRFQYDLYGHTNYWYALAVLAVVFFVVRRIVYSPFGQALTGIRENVGRMNAIGSPVHRRLVTVYAISAAIAGMAGALFTQTNAYVTLTVFDFDTSAKVMVMLILGGTGRLYGAFVGATVYMVLEDYLSKASPTFWQFGIGILLVLVVLFARRGLLGVVEGIGTLRRRGSATAPPATPRRFVWKPDYWRALGASALDGALIGFLIGFAGNLVRADRMTLFISSFPARVAAFIAIGALFGIGINMIYLLVIGRTTVEGRTS